MRTNSVYRYVKYKVELMQLVNAPAIFQRMMDEVFRGIPLAMVYLNDVLIFSETLEEQI